MGVLCKQFNKHYSRGKFLSPSCCGEYGGSEPESGGLSGRLCLSNQKKCPRKTKNLKTHDSVKLEGIAEDGWRVSRCTLLPESSAVSTTTMVAAPGFPCRWLSWWPKVSTKYLKFNLEINRNLKWGRRAAASDWSAGRRRRRRLSPRLPCYRVQHMFPIPNYFLLFHKEYQKVVLYRGYGVNK